MGQPLVDKLRATNSRDNASYLVHLYEELGAGFLERVNGWFSGILVDLREKKVVIFNDRYGISRIYFHQLRRAFTSPRSEGAT